MIVCIIKLSIFLFFFLDQRSLFDLLYNNIHVLYNAMVISHSSFNKDKKDNIHKNEVQYILDDQTTFDKYRLAANITDYHIISKLILQQIIITNLGN